jgi:hypothetical protein
MRPGVLGKARELNLTEWAETIAREYGEDTSDLPWADEDEKVAAIQEAFDATDEKPAPEVPA